MTSLSDTIQERVSIWAVLAQYGVKGEGTMQISCLAHRPDIHKSCRVYGETNSMYCFTCSKTWDVVGLVMELEEMTFREACSTLAQKFDIHVTDVEYMRRFWRAQAPPSADCALAASLAVRGFYINSAVVDWDVVDRLWREWESHGFMSTEQAIEWMHKAKEELHGND